MDQMDITNMKGVAEDYHRLPPTYTQNMQCCIDDIDFGS